MDRLSLLVALALSLSGGPAGAAAAAPPAEPSLRDTATVSVNGVVTAPGASAIATVTLGATAGHRGLVLTVPLAGLPDGFTVDSATLPGATCAVGRAAIGCTGVDLVADSPVALRIGVTVAESAGTGVAWRAAGVTLSAPGNGDDRVAAAGTLVGAAAAGYTVRVTVGVPRDPAPPPGGTTVLPVTVHNAGPDRAADHPVAVLLPPGTTHGALPAGCAEGGGPGVLVCRRSLAPAAAERFRLPLIVGRAARPGDVLTGGCVDEALGAGLPSFDLSCGGAADVPLPDLRVGRGGVDMAVRYRGGPVPLPAGGSLVVRVPYGNDGSGTAAGVRFAVDLPAGVTVHRAAIRPAAAGTGTAVSCSAGGGAVTCVAPDAAARSGGELRLTLRAGPQAPAGDHEMRVTVSATGTDGDQPDDTVLIPLRLAGPAAAAGGLPVTGTGVTGPALLAMLLLAAGAALLRAARRDGRQAPG